MNSVIDADRKHILERSGDLWEALRGARIFVTGGTGFVGTWMMEAFAAANEAYHLQAKAVLLTRDPVRFHNRAPHLAKAPSLEFVTGNATSFTAPQGSFDYIVHAATERSFEPDAARPLGILEPDLIATRRVLDLAVSSGARRFLFTSSGAVYGASASTLERVPENYSGAPDVLEARGAYGESKRVSEFACTSYARLHGFDAVVARLFAFSGPHLPLDEGYAIGNFVRDVLQGRNISIAGDGTARRSYLYAADLAVWLWTLLIRGTAGRAYNVGSPDAVTIQELADTVAQTLAPGTDVSVARSPVPGAAPSNYIPDTTRAQQELALRAWIDLPDALRRTHAFYLETQRTTAAL